MPDDLPIPADLDRPPEAPDDSAILSLALAHPEEADLHPGEVHAQRFAITDDGTAEWAMRKLAEVERQALANEARADAWAAKISRWLDSANGALQHSHAYFEGLLVDYARRRREADPRAKTLVLPSGKVTSRATGARALVTQPEQFVEWATAKAPSLVVVKRAPDLTELKRLATLKPEELGVYVDGERVPGTVMEPPGVSYSVKVT